MTLWEEAEIFELGGISFYAWGLFCALGMAAKTQEANALNARAMRAASIGDCKKARRIREAVSDGYFAAMDI